MQHRNTPVDLAPWRSIDALSERLNQGATSRSFSPHALRHYVRHADHNGLRPFVRRLGRKILISEPGFDIWLAEQADQGRAA